MHPHYVPIDSQFLKRLYVDEQLTAEEIAGQLGCAPTTVLRRLRKFGIAARPQGPQIANSNALPSPYVWSPDLAYVVGLMATDGNLSRTRWGLSLASKDSELLETVRRCLRLTNAITPYTDSLCYHIQWRDRRLYTWLVEIGLMPAKSLTLGPLKIPEEYFADFFRGCIDGDGTVLVYEDQYHVAKKKSYVYDRLYVYLYSASLPFLNWVRARICTTLGVSGAINERRKGDRACWSLRYAKAESIRLLGWIYYAADVPCLLRKREKAERYLSPLGFSPSRPQGRPRVGWLYNEVIADLGRGGGTGRLAALKTPCPQGLRGSTPLAGTIP